MQAYARKLTTQRVIHATQRQATIPSTSAASPTPPLLSGTSERASVYFAERRFDPATSASTDQRDATAARSRYRVRSPASCADPGWVESALIVETKLIRPSEGRQRGSAYSRTWDTTIVVKGANHGCLPSEVHSHSRSMSCFARGGRSGDFANSLWSSKFNENM